MSPLGCRTVTFVRLPGARWAILIRSASIVAVCVRSTRVMMSPGAIPARRARERPSQSPPMSHVRASLPIRRAIRRGRAHGSRPRTECSSLGTSQPRAEAAPVGASRARHEFGALHSLGAFAELPNRIAETGVQGEGRLPRGVRWPGRPAVRRGPGPRGGRRPGGGRRARRQCERRGLAGAQRHLPRCSRPPAHPRTRLLRRRERGGRGGGPAPRPTGVRCVRPRRWHPPRGARTRRGSR